MPYVNVKVAGSLTLDQKKEIVEGITNVIHKATDKPKDATYIVLEEINRENWAKGTKLLSEN